MGNERNMLNREQHARAKIVANDIASSVCEVGDERFVAQKGLRHVVFLVLVLVVVRVPLPAFTQIQFVSASFSRLCELTVSEWKNSIPQYSMLP